MSYTRRDVLATGAIAAGWSLLPSGLAVASVDLGGGATLQTASDGAMTLSKDFFYEGLDRAAVDGILSAHGAGGSDTVRRPCNVTILRAGGRVVLFDLGAGPAFMDGTGELAGTLEALGLGPAEVTDVIFTHGHPDHLWGLLDDFDELVFPDADYHIGQVEWDYWTDPATLDAPGSESPGFIVGAARRLGEISDRVQLFKGGDDLPGGVVAVEAFGHTPGHMTFRAGSDGTMIIADTFVDDSVCLSRPDWPMARDTDKEAAIATRMKTLDLLAVDAVRVVGFHFGGGGIGRIDRTEDGYAFIPEL